MSNVKIVVRCHNCKVDKELTEEEQQQAQEMGCVICDQCYGPMVVKRAGGVL